MTKIVDLFATQGRFLRSAHLERDFYDPSALQGYVVTPNIQGSLDRISAALNPSSGQRAWRITGDYGSGKSSFALLLAHLLSGRATELPVAVKRGVDIKKFGSGNGLLPVLITGSREPLTAALVRGLVRALASLPTNRKLQKSLEALGTASRREATDIDSNAISLIQDTADQLAKTGSASGLLIVLDELGKFLEFAALHPERQDILILQQLAELSSRSGEQPIVTVGLLHQGFHAYTDQLSQASQREWEKVAGRFEELLFNQPLDQITHLVADALNLRISSTPRGWDSRATTMMRKVVSLGWFGPGAPSASLAETSGALYPLHPTVIPVLVRLFGRFGQNERSLFSFLFSNEPFGLQAFSQQPALLTSLFRIHNLYDFAAANFGHRLGLQSYRNHWNHIDSLVRSFSEKGVFALHVLKTIGLLNLINAPELQPTETAIIVALGDGIQAEEVRIRDSLKELHQEKKLLYFRGPKLGYWLWGHTSINLEIAYDEAGKVVGSQRRVADTIKTYLETRPIVARRHYIQTGNLRHFDVHYCSVLELERVLSEEPDSSDGKLVIPLLETKEEVMDAEAIVRKTSLVRPLLVGITEPLASLGGLVQEVDRWRHIEKTTPELKDDRYAYEEVMRRSAVATLTLERRVQHYVGLRETSQSDELMPIRWFRGATLQPTTSVSSFLSLLSDICDEAYNESPIVHNELLNRRSLSSAAAAARMRLLERMLESSSRQFFGMDESKKPPEMSMYLSVLLNTRLHRVVNNDWILANPEEGDDPCRLRPALIWIYSYLTERPEQRVNVETIFDGLKRPPFGVRDGLLPLLLLVTILQYQHGIAVYEDGTFKSQLIGPDILRLSKDPKCFELQWVKIEGVRLEVFNKMAGLFNVTAETSPEAEVLDIVRPLCQFVAKLPAYVRQTTRLDRQTGRVRDAILEAREPAKLLFRDLPVACGIEPFIHSGTWNKDRTIVVQFVNELQRSLEDLKVAMTGLRDRIAQQITDSFGLPISPSKFQNARDALAQRSERLLLRVADVELKALCLRLFDNHMPEADWIESIGSLVAALPPSKWKDHHEDIFRENLGGLVQRFLRVESVNFAPVTGTTIPAHALRIAVTQQDGSEQHEVIYLNKDEQQRAKKITENLRSALGSDHRIALSALGKLTWELLEAKNEQR
jgi:hypothetical protein